MSESASAAVMETKLTMQSSTVTESFINTEELRNAEAPIVQPLKEYEQGGAAGGDPVQQMVITQLTGLRG